MGPCAETIYNKLTSIQFGLCPDDMGWTVTL